MTVVASFDVSTAQGKLRVFNAKNGASTSMKKVAKDEVLEVVDVMQYQEMIDSYGGQQEATVTVLFTSDGHSYAGVSETVASAGEDLIDLLSEIEAVNVKVVTQTSAGGRDFLNLQVVL